MIISIPTLIMYVQSLEKMRFVQAYVSAPMWKIKMSLLVHDITSLAKPSLTLEHGWVIESIHIEKNNLSVLIYFQTPMHKWALIMLLMTGMSS